jgi:hypothetical protein
MKQHRKLLRTLVLVGVVTGIAKCLRGKAWRMTCGPEGELSAKGWHNHHGQTPPWFKDWRKPYVEGTEEAGPPAEVATIKV